MDMKEIFIELTHVEVIKWKYLKEGNYMDVLGSVLGYT